ncbi:MAG: hypothetical protein H0X40_13640 [Chthoniobacterales bacterium]|nr:hypothetical protein [Chthoniobacterales bacterium]
MTTTYYHQTENSRPFRSTDLKSALLEPLLVVSVSAFWIVTLPFAAVSLLGVKLWDTASAFSRKTATRNPLILRRGQATNDSALPQSASPKKV